MQNRPRQFNRRSFMRGAAAVAGFHFVPAAVLGGNGRRPPSGKINIACIGAGGRGQAQINGCKGENIIALVDVDEKQGYNGFKQFPQAKKYHDFRVMFDEMEDKIDAVCVSTPDHTHAVAAMAALKRKKHVYCEKPLAHSIGEIRALMGEARKQKVVTQLGNQGHSFDDIRRFCEWIWDGAIGDVTEVHAACGANHCKINQLGRRDDDHDIPKTLDWDLWLGPAKKRKYNPMYLPGSWRGWLPFGSGTIGDWVCHVVDPVFWALDLGAPTSIVCNAKGYDPKEHADTFPNGSIIEFEFPAKGKRGPVKLVWFDGVEKIPQPKDLEPGRKPPGTGAVVYGTTGAMQYGSHGAGGVRIFPEEKMKAYKRPEQTLPRTRGHHNDWLEAIRNGGQAGSNFDYGGPLTELARLGIIATQMLGTKLQWDSEAMKFTNCDEANKYVDPPVRKGWEF